MDVEQGAGLRPGDAIPQGAIEPMSVVEKDTKLMSARRSGLGVPMPSSQERTANT